MPATQDLSVERFYICLNFFKPTDSFLFYSFFAATSWHSAAATATWVGYVIYEMCVNDVYLYIYRRVQQL